MGIPHHCGVLQVLALARRGELRSVRNLGGKAANSQWEATERQREAKEKQWEAKDRQWEAKDRQWEAKERHCRTAYIVGWTLRTTKKGMVSAKQGGENAGETQCLCLTCSGRTRAQSR